MAFSKDRSVSIHPYFKVADGKMDAFKQYCEQYIAATNSEPKCLYYGFTFHDNEVYCREAYEDAESVLAHLSNVGTLLDAILKIAEVMRLEVHGPEDELAKLREPLAAFNPTYFTLQYGIRR